MINTEQLFQVLTRSNFEEILVKVRHLKYQQQEQQQQQQSLSQDCLRTACSRSEIESACSMR